MQSHQDRPDHAPSLLEELGEKAEALTDERENLITAGDVEKEGGEKPLRSWTIGGADDKLVIRQMPDDEHGVLRISVGGNVGFQYCVFRGPRKACVTLLRRAMQALERGQ